MNYQDNRWRKRGLAVMPMMWPYEVLSVMGFGVLVSIYAQDGTVAICHSGVELGQGINTKVSFESPFVVEIFTHIQLFFFTFNNNCYCDVCD